MLERIEQLIRNNGPLSASMIARQLGSHPAAIEGMLELLVKRGHLQHTINPASCGGGCGCAAGEADVHLYACCTNKGQPLLISQLH